ncbi:helix-turn-helix domain-containing protein [Cohnella thailandensis]|jgi:Predicted transcriptional regulators|uniref:Helix-turn-helix transcriptional regulator n=1 Tax=Cohnella thailandensis TaxID=557557 RepID=A0A841SY57_9BACL|nr:helix-turn-helix transcriptional regulator [Cohnella thailandensis]MBB6635108.1 helix-turn-helix transcriptional regulator [Cohnella thailandensis]MBP1974426.1 transcriptional regulator with XRE-family HTH domain [Cohnella thailandensis]
MNIGNRIAELRDARALTQEQLATTLGISRAALSHYEKNRRQPDFDTLIKLADEFNVSVDYLLGRTKRPEITLDPVVRQFVDDLELSEQEILERFSLKVDGTKLSPEEAKRFIAFVRAERSMETNG